MTSGGPTAHVRGALIDGREWMRRRIGRHHEARILARGVPEWRDIPVIINSRNRLEYLRTLVEWLERAGSRNVIILDNDSSFPPLLAYYERTPHRVVRLGRNLGPRALWRCRFHREVRDRYYVLTDPDVVPDETCPTDAVGFFLDALLRHRGIAKVGFGLRIDDLPECYARKPEVIRWESRFWQKPFDGSFFQADIDTTFALYRPWVQWGPCLRSGPPYVARHLPWYRDSSSPPEEDRFYAASTLPGSTWWMGPQEKRDAVLRSSRPE